MFEDLCRDWVWAETNSGGWQPEEYGACWQRQKEARVQLGVVAVSPHTKHILVGEAKWTDSPIGRGVIACLVERSRRMMTALLYDTQPEGGPSGIRAQTAHVANDTKSNMLSLIHI